MAYFAVLRATCNDRNTLWEWYRKIPNAKRIDDMGLMDVIMDDSVVSGLKRIVTIELEPITKVNCDDLPGLMEREAQLLRSA